VSKQIVLELDGEDETAVNKAIAYRQTFRDCQGCIMPDSGSNLAGSLIAEICRGWLEGHKKWNWSEDGSS
jgi:hypothetical protein